MSTVRQPSGKADAHPTFHLSNMIKNIFFYKTFAGTQKC